MNLKKSIWALLAIPAFAMPFICGCHKNNPTPATSHPGGPSAIVSAEKTSFDAVTGKLNKGGNLYVFVNTEQMLTGLSERMATASNIVSGIPKIDDEKRERINAGLGFFQHWLADSGVEEIGGLGVSSIAREPGFYYGKLVLYHEPGQDDGLLWKLFGAEPHPLEGLDMLPEHTVLAFFSDFDLPLAWQSIKKEVKQMNNPQVADAVNKYPQQFKDSTGLDFDQTLASLGGSYGIILTLDPSQPVSIPVGAGTMDMPSPALAIVLKVKSDLIFDRVEQKNKKNPMIIRVNRPNLKMRTFAIPLPLPVEFRPTIARSGDYLLLASTDALVEEMVDVKAGKKKGFKSTPEFARLSQDIPAKGNDFALITAQFMKSISALQQQAATNQETTNALQSGVWRQAFSGTNGGNFAVGVNDSEGWEGFANGSHSVQSMLWPLAAGLCIMTAIAVPNLVKPHHTTQADKPVPAAQNVKYNPPARAARPDRNPAPL